MSSIFSSVCLEALLSETLETNKRWLILIDGTWCHHNSRTGTIVRKLEELIICDEYQEPRYYPGIGTALSFTDRFIGGTTGWGIKRRLFKVFCELVADYHSGDEMIIIGYSRGAYMAQVLSGLLDCVGLPQDQTIKSLNKSFNLFWENQLDDLTFRQELKNQNRSIDVPIHFLGCFDTVGALGVPQTGLLTPLKWSPKLVKHLEFRNTELPKNVLKFRHALALDEYRETFSPTLMHINVDSDRDVKQVWFSGSHYDLGKMDPHGTGLFNVALRWMIEELTIAGVRFSQPLLKAHFPKYTNDPAALKRENSDEWVEASVHCTWTLLWSGGGMKKRVPGWYGLEGKKTNEFIHPTIHHRQEGSNSRKRPSLEGHHRIQREDGTFYWKKTGNWSPKGSWSLDGSRSSSRIDMKDTPEEEFGVLQAQLGGYPFIW